MTDVLDPASVVAAAQEAASAGDFPAAERLLREAAAIQEASLGALHPDLASTLNNLAFVCERTNKLADAERGYRRAHAIAVASLGPRHPFVATSLKNLVDFCAAHGIPIWSPPAARSSPATEVQIATVTEPARPVQGTGSAEPTPAHPRGWALRGWALLGVAAIAAVVFTMPWSGSRGTPPTVRQERSPETTPAPVQRPSPQPEAQRPEPRATNVTPAPVTVLNAQLCSALAKTGSPDWQCTSASGDLRPGTYTFYTRLLTNTSTTVEHHWYHDERVHRVVRLRVTASPGVGYRTFSSNSISPERAGNWRVELRAADGTLLQEERFVIRPRT